jgi:hypothetical protein
VSDRPNISCQKGCANSSQSSGQLQIEFVIGTSLADTSLFIEQQMGSIGKNPEEILQLMNWIEATFRRCETWARNNWPSNIPQINAIEKNPCLHEGCLCLQRFLQATNFSDAGDPVAGQTTCWAWHGSSDSGVIGICCEGWRTSFHRAQGDYFGWTASVSHGYCKGNDHMIVALIIKNHLVQECPSSYYIVNNPASDTGPCYCLPVAVVSYGGQTKMTGWRHPHHS